ncbi:hypothetical protein ACS0TY_031551 [Phlomoides rotata]
MGEWEGDIWSWSWRWRRPLWDYELNSLNALINVINRDAQFNEETLKGFKLVWKSSALMKVIAHAWRLIWGRLPTKSNLRRRGILKPTDDLRCIFCGYQEETEKHIFFECTIAHGIWMECFAWFQCSTAIHPGGNVERDMLHVFGLEWFDLFGNGGMQSSSITRSFLKRNSLTN